MAFAHVVAGRAPPPDIGAIVQEAVIALQQVQGQPLPPPDDMPLSSIVAVELMGQTPGQRPRRTAIGQAVANIWLAAAGDPALRRFLPVQGDGQIARPGETLLVRPAIRITDGFGQPLLAVPVTFVPPAPGDGQVAAPAQTATDATGIAVCNDWTLGAGAGLKTLAAQVNGLTVVTFRAVAV